MKKVHHDIEFTKLRRRLDHVVSINEKIALLEQLVALNPYSCGHEQTSQDQSPAAADTAADAAEGAKSASTGLTTLVYGAIGASLIAALAAIVSLMQISRRIAG